jgi:chromosome segregation ATPase
MAITKEQIFAAATDLAATGAAATLAAVRKAVGGGSYTTISEALKEWRALQPAETAIQERAPQALSDRLAGVINETWTIALDMANDRLKTEREALEGVRIELEQSRKEAVDLADQLSADLEQAQATIAQQNALEAARGVETARQAAEVARTAGELAEARESAHTAQAALAESHTRAEQLTALLEREQAGRAEAVERAAQAEQAGAVLASRLENAGRHAGELEARAAKFEQQSLTATRELASAHVAIQAGQARLESAARELDDAREQAREARAAARKAGEEAAELRGRMATEPKLPRAPKSKA